MVDSGVVEAQATPPRTVLVPRFWRLLWETIRMKAEYDHERDTYADHLNRFYTRDVNAHVQTFGDKWAEIRPVMIDLADMRPDDEVLDVATGVGFQAKAFAHAGYKTVGVDLIPDRVKHAEEIHGNHNPSWKVGDATNLPFDDNSFDVVTMSLALHDMPLDVELKALSEMRRVSRRRVVIVEPQVWRGLLRRRFYIWFGETFDESVYFGDFVRRDFNAHLKQVGLKVTHRQRVFHRILTIFACDVN